VIFPTFPINKNHTRTLGGLAEAKVFAQQSRELTEQRVLELKERRYKPKVGLLFLLYMDLFHH